MAFQQNLLKWFKQSARPLPWRRHYRPYEVWISEIMLQQTQMDTVLPYYERWMKTFPDIHSLARSDEHRVLKLWEGLGYYSRARNLHHTAKEIVSKSGGIFPRGYEEILALKGVGRYTAGAIASIAFNDRKPIVDGNVVRVLARIFTIQKPVDQLKNREEFWKLQESLIPKDSARDFNQALMELGALVCTSENPACRLCPIRKHCQAFQTDQVDRFPVRSKRKKMVKVEAVALVLEKDEKIFIHKRPLGKIMGGLWEFPEWKLNGRKSVNFEKELGIKIENLKFLGEIKRNYTHHLERLRVFVGATRRVALTREPKSDWPSAWASQSDFKKYPFSSAHAKISNLL